MGAISKAVGGVTKTLFGGGSQTSTASSSVNAAPASAEELQLQKALMQESNPSTSPFAQSEGDLSNAFKQQLAKFLATNNGQLDPNVLKQATEYVDQTFTNPAQASFDKWQRQFQANQYEQAAVMGRQPTDSSLEALRYVNAQDQQNNIANERANRIAQRSDVMGYQRPMESLNFISSLNDQAFKNRLNLMNLQSGLYNQMQNFRLGTASRSQTNTTSGQDNGILGGLAGMAKGFGGLGGIASAAMSGGGFLGALKAIDSYNNRNKGGGTTLTINSGNS